MARRFISGQRVRKLPTNDLNEAINAARDREVFGTRAATMPLSGQFFVDVLNDTGDDLDQWAAVGFEDPLIDPADNEPAFRDGIGFVGVTPTHADHLERFGVLLSPIPDGQVGPALLRGWLNCKVDVINVEHQYVRPKDGTAALETCGAGGGRILWPRPFTATGEQWATVNLARLESIAVEGYLSEALPPASRDPDTAAFAPGEAMLNVWAWRPDRDDTDDPPAKIWINLETTITLRNTSETLTGEEDCYCRAVWIGDSWRPEEVSCAASLIPQDWRDANP
jgi:hypothetical protein